jgi:two-component system response regulator HydG
MPLKEGAYEIIYKPPDIDKVVSLVERASENKDGTLILMADDNPGICITMKNIFMKKDYKVGIVHTGEEAVVIIMTAFRQEVKDIVEKALNNSAYAYLYKPLDMEEVLELVEEIWKRKKEKGADTL